MIHTKIGWFAINVKINIQQQKRARKDNAGIHKNTHVGILYKLSNNKETNFKKVGQENKVFSKIKNYINYLRFIEKTDKNLLN